MHYILWKLLEILFERYIWMDVELITETTKAILVMLDGRKVWLPKAWIWGIKQDKNKRTIKIKISQYQWVKKFE